DTHLLANERGLPLGSHGPGHLGLVLSGRLVGDAGEARVVAARDGGRDARRGRRGNGRPAAAGHRRPRLRRSKAVYAPGGGRHNGRGGDATGGNSRLDISGDEGGVGFASDDAKSLCERNGEPPIAPLAQVADTGEDSTLDVAGALELLQ